MTKSKLLTLLALGSIMAPVAGSIFLGDATANQAHEHQKWTATGIDPQDPELRWVPVNDGQQRLLAVVDLGDPELRWIPAGDEQRLGAIETDIGDPEMRWMPVSDDARRLAAESDQPEQEMLLFRLA